MAKRKAPRRRTAAARRKPARKAAARTKKAARARRARKQARKATRKRGGARKAATRPRKASARKAAGRKVAARKAPARKAPGRKAPARKAPARKAPARKAPGTPKRRTGPKASTKAPRRPRAVQAATDTPVTTRPSRPRMGPPMDLDRERRRLSDEERLVPGSDARQISSARTGHDEMRERLREHTESGPELSGGDVDARWDDAYATGDEAPGGGSPTPDQDRVDDIGKALGITYEDNQELQGGKEVEERDRHRWEYDPASSEDWPHDRKKE